MNSELQNIQWFPGHMAKTRRKISESLKLVDAVAEIVDARIPVSSRNPDLDELVAGKPRVVLLNKCDLADPAQTQRWIAFCQKHNMGALAIDCKSGKGFSGVLPLLRGILREQIARWEEKGMKGHPIRVMIVGIPNVGKSSFINRMSKGKKARVEDRPGVTRGNQWFTVEQGVEFLDTPGVLWPKFDDAAVAEHLAFTGAIKDQVMDVELLAIRLLDLLKTEYPQSLGSRYRLGDTFEQTGYELLELVGRKRGMLVSGGGVDTERAAVMVLDEYRSGKVGAFTLEQEKDYGERFLSI